MPSLKLVLAHFCVKMDSSFCRGESRNFLKGATEKMFVVQSVGYLEKRHCPKAPPFLTYVAK